MKIKGVLIDPNKMLVESVEFDGFDDMKKKMGVDLVQLCPNLGKDKWNAVNVYCDEEGLYSREYQYTMTPWYPRPIAGPIMLVGKPADFYGDEERDCPYSALQIASGLLWVDRKSMELEE